MGTKIWVIMVMLVGRSCQHMVQYQSCRRRIVPVGDSTMSRPTHQGSEGRLLPRCAARITATYQGQVNEELLALNQRRAVRPTIHIGTS